MSPIQSKPPNEPGRADKLENLNATHMAPHIATPWQRVRYLYRLNSNRQLMLAFALYFLMLVLASIQPLERGLINLFNDKLLHLLFYMALTVLIFRGLTIAFFVERILATFGIGISLAALDEFLQLFSSHRQAQFDDWLYDVLGVVFILSLAIALHAAEVLIRRLRGLPPAEDGAD
jgi:VanZ family protein